VIGEKVRWPTIALLTLCLLGGLLRKATAAEDAVVVPEGGLSGRFLQTISDEGGGALSTSEGEFALLKPHFFRWQINAPGRQLIISDGQTVWQYDQDLETVSRSPATHVAQSPLALLLGDVASLEQHYLIDYGDGQITLVPTAAEPLFESLTVMFNDNQATQLLIADSSGQMIHITLSDTIEGALAPDDFRFIPPDEINVVDLES